jgi:hypothetical protein
MEKISLDISRMANLEELKFNLALQKFNQSHAQIAIVPDKNCGDMDHEVVDATVNLSD